MPELDSAFADPAGHRAVKAFTRLVRTAGRGSHQISVVAVEGEGSAYHASCTVSVDREDRVRYCPEKAVDVVVVFRAAFGVAPVIGAGVLVRTLTEEGSRVQGWRLQGQWLTPLSEGEIFDAACTGPDGDVQPPEYGVTYAAGAPLGPPPLV
ncbi:hypothetical protein LIX60_30585 [Streptomyces sp. S07_1.15]|uniref:hypothetical protein n=1 Tax=Streptomyces sp. S07_1.15 TaxID=2873925 RepID=UPI001D1391E9|nr:hypothetical protein [Streptomyces sp. S07_1.15]MCC3655730.1 hypothetical protein [Streptomyces sp. S07_1.15]